MRSTVSDSWPIDRTGTAAPRDRRRPASDHRPRDQSVRADKLDSQSGWTKTKERSTSSAASISPRNQLLAARQIQGIDGYGSHGPKGVHQHRLRRKNGWLNVNGQPQPLDDKILNELKEAANLFKVGRLLRLKVKDEYALSPWAKHRSTATSRRRQDLLQGFRDVNIYFDKRLDDRKGQRTTVDFMTQQEVSEERLILEYQDVDGHKVPKKLLVNRNGKKFMDCEILEYKANPKLEAADFAKR